MSIQTRPDVTVPTTPATGSRRPTRRSGPAAAAVLGTVAVGIGLTALVLGVTDGSENEGPPSPGIAPVVVDDAMMQGLDRRLYNLAEQHAAERRAWMQLAPGADQRLHNLAGE